MQSKNNPLQRHHGVSGLAIALALSVVLSATARADDDPPTRVGRISFTQGAVSLRQNANSDWAPATPNYPVAAGASIWADQGARAEIEIGGAVVRLDAGTEVDIVQLDDQNIIVSVPQGTADVSLRYRGPAELYDIQTPRGDADLLDHGTYRVFAGSQQDPTRVASFGGNAQFQGSSQLTIGSNLEVVASTDSPPNYAVVPANPDGFDQWALQREAAYEQPVPSYVPPVPGVEVLAQYGAWQDSPDYGHVWIPTSVGPDWAPYRHGHWAFVAPWGYTWVDDAPWGFAPFHYGRWIQTPGGWGWVPRDPGAEVAIGYRPAYAPALVSFIGSPDALTVGIGIGAVGVSVGWFPLGPGEPFHPWYPHSDNYVRDVNIVSVNRTVINNINTTVINNNTTYINQRAATVVPQQAFAGGRPIAQVAYHIPPQALARPIQVAPATEVAARILPKPVEPERNGNPAFQAKAPPKPALHIAPGARTAETFRATNARLPAVERPTAPANEPARVNQAVHPAVAPEASPRVERPGTPETPKVPQAERPAVTQERPAVTQERPAASPRPEPQSEHPATVSRPTPAPVERPAAPVERPAAPVERQASPAERPAAPAERPAAPVERQAAPAERPVVQPARPTPQIERPAAPPQNRQQPPAPKKEENKKDEKNDQKKPE